MISNLYIYDVIFLALFIIVGTTFLIIKRKNLQRQGLLYLYRTQIGIKIIEKTSKKFPKLLKYLQYLVVVCGYLLMIGIVWMIIKFAWFYLTSPSLARSLKIPVLLPLLPYVPEVFKLTFLPPFYFTYWIIIIAIIAIPHEFAHGIFARINKIKVHATGFGFLGPFLAAFVEPDEKQMNKLKKFPQLAILGSGTFANVLMTILFALILWIFFTLAFQPSGLYFNSYATSYINNSEISSINGVPLANLNLTSLNNSGFIQISAYNYTYYTTPEIIRVANQNNLTYIPAFDDAPAFKVKLEGAITDIGQYKITSYKDLNKSIASFKPGDNVIIKTLNVTQVLTYNITFANRNGHAFLGVGFLPQQRAGILTTVYSFITQSNDPSIYYQSKLGGFGIFIKDLLWWVVVVNISVALVNMLPLGIFDGGRFFYLTIWGITRSEKAGKYAYKFSTWFLLALVAAMMVKWAVAFA